jgi:opacity protein-like surface antigen
MRNKFITVVLAITLIFGMTTIASSEMYIGGQFGPNFNSSMDVKVSGPFATNTIYNMKPRTGFTSGLVFGYDFVNYRTGAANYPDWMRYFGVMVDVSYTQMNFSAQRRTVANNKTIFSPSVDGGNTALTFLFTGKLPCMVDSEYPNGRLAPYVGVGPSILFTSMDFSNLGGSNTTGVNVGLAAEAGVKYMITPSFSAGLAYRYRYAQPSVSNTLAGVGNVTMKGPMNNSQIIGRLAYHF